MSYKVIILAVIFLWSQTKADFSTSVVPKVGCKNEQGKDVDWFYMYKLPKHYQNKENKNDKSGLRYIFVTNENFKDSWKLSTRQIDANDSLTAQTLEPVLSDVNVLLMAYNDEFPNGTTKPTRGHTKGVIATDLLSGFWLIHSIPKFPNIPVYSYPTSAQNYGQSVLCVTLKAQEMHKVGTQLLLNEPHIYYHNIPSYLQGHFPELERAIDKKWLRAAPYYNTLQISSFGGTTFKSFAKNARFNGDLYEDIVAPELDVNLLVESWRNGGGNLPSDCAKSDKVYNVAELESDNLHLSFKSTADHSKWAVSQASGVKLWRWRIGGSDWICVGDINRQQHQTERGGGTLCQQHTIITEIYRDLISQYEPCARKSKLIN